MYEYTNSVVKYIIKRLQYIHCRKFLYLWVLLDIWSVALIDWFNLKLQKLFKYLYALYILESIGDRLCERVLSVLFEMWLLCCTKSFPPPPFWKTFRETSAYWRHHEALITQWHRINVILTSKLLKRVQGADYPELIIRKFLTRTI